MAGPSFPPGLHASLVRHTGYLLSRMGFWAQRQFSIRMEELGLTPRMWGALNVLAAEGPVTQQELGKSIGMDPSTMVATIDELESQGLVERRRHPSDRRAYALQMTEEGRDRLARGRELAAQAQSQLLAPLSEDERGVLHDLLLRLAQAADTAGAGGAARPADAESTDRASGAARPADAESTDRASAAGGAAVTED
jgi:DNA-binding MarR family transcriptional regulator